MGYNTKLGTLDGVGALRSLKELSAVDCGLRDVAALGGNHVSLARLWVQHNPLVKDYYPLGRLPALVTAEVDAGTPTPPYLCVPGVRGHCKFIAREPKGTVKRCKQG